jgi:4-amino-4-deoxy-L-arabinose transferase-like glycosyltransferase
MTIRRVNLIALTILVLTFALRVYRLGVQSLWYDEGLSVYLASLPLDETIAQSAATDHPPLHALLLNLWLSVAGSSEYSARFASAFFGTLAGALTLVLGRRAGGARAGLVAAALLGISPMAVWYAQEARGYSLLVALVLVAALAFLRLVSGDGRRRVWLAYILACTAALYTHYFAAFPIVAISLTFTYDVVRRRSTESAAPGARYATLTPRLRASASAGVRDWLAAQAAIVLLFLPWLPNALAQASSNATYFPGRVTWDTVVLDTWRAFAGGDFPHLLQPNLPPPTSALWLAVILLGTLAPLLPSRAATTEVVTTGRSRIHASLMLLALVLIPLFLMSLLAWEKPKFAPRYLLPSLPAFVTLAALGVDALLRLHRRVLAASALLPLLIIPAVDVLVIAQIYFDPPVARPDARAVAAYVAANDAPDDAILLVGGHQLPVFEYYYRGPADVVPLPPGLLPAAQSPLDARAVAQLADIAATHSRAWLVLWQQAIADPTSTVLDELEAHAKRLQVGQNFHEMSLLLLDLRGARFAPGPQTLLDVSFAEPIRLVGYNLDSNQITAGQDLNFTLYFESKGPLERNYQVFTHLIGPDGSLAAQDDRIAGADSYPTSLWVTGAQVRVRFRIRLPADSPAGAYRLIAGLYDDVGRLAVSSGGDAVEIATIEVKP